MCSQNLPEPTVIPSEHFDVTLYTGDGGSDRTITTGLDAEEQVWVKDRATSGAETRVADTVRGGNKHLKTQQSHDESTDTNVIKSFSGGTFNVGSDSAVNYNTRTYVTWAWKAGTTTSGTTSGSGTGKAYSASYNSDAGFSIIGYLGNGTSGHTIPHHLSKAPELIIVKNRDYNGTEWSVGSLQPLASMDWTDVLYMHQNTAVADWNLWNDTAPTSSVFSVHSNAATNDNDDNIKAN